MSYPFVFFDFDGVIAQNSQVLGFERLSLWLQSTHHISLSTLELTQAFLGMPTDVVFAQLNQHYHLSIDLSEIPQMRAAQQDIVWEGVVYDPGLIALLNTTERGYICSSNVKTMIERVLKKLQLDAYFPSQHIFTRETVTHPKPAPDIYLQALDYAKCPVADAIAIEDSEVGVQAAVAAGLSTLGYLGGIPKIMRNAYAKRLERAGACRCIDSFDALM